MNSKELEKKLNKMSKKIVNLNEKTEKKKATTKAEVNKLLKSAKEELDGLQNNIKNNVGFELEQDKNKIASTLLKQKMIVDAKKEDFNKKITKKKFENAKEKAKYELMCRQEYAAYVIEATLLLAQEAEIAVLEAVQCEQEFEEEFRE